MENKLHAEKLAILSRLIKESSLTLEEALLLLKEEEQSISMPPISVPAPINIPHHPYGVDPFKTWISTGTGDYTTINCTLTN